MGKLHFPRRGVAIALVLLAIVAALVLLAVFAWPSGPRTGEARWVDAGLLDAIPANQPLRFAEERFWLVRLSSGEVLALWQADPNDGCTVPWRPDFDFLGHKGWFRNPCHAQTYDLAGRCFAGPCPRGLDRFPLEVRDGRVRVNVKATILGPPVDAGAQPFAP